MHLEIVSHCFKYSRLLAYQLSSLVINPPAHHKVTATVYYCVDDLLTTKTLSYFGHQEVPNVQWRWKAQAKELVCNRAIGRDLSARSSRADWLHFADCDYAYGDGFLDRLCDLLMDEQADLVYPRTVLACEHDIGAQLVAAVKFPTVLTIPAEHFVPQKFNRAIGGVQFARGSVCKAKGYVGGDERLLQPSPQGWLRESADRTFRVSLGTAGKAINCPGLFRIRHSREHGRIRNDEK